MCLCFRSIIQRCVIRSMGDFPGKKPTSPSNGSPSQQRRLCVTGSVSMPSVPSPWTCRAFTSLHLIFLAVNQERIGFLDSWHSTQMFAIQSLEVSIQSRHKTSTPQMLWVFTSSSRQFMTCTQIFPLNTFGTWMKKAFNLVEAKGDQRSISISRP